MDQQTLVLIKPDSVRRRMVGQIVTSIESLGLTIEDLQMKTLSKDEATALYREHIGRWHFSRNLSHITSGPVVIMKVAGTDAVDKCRQMVVTFREAHKDLIRLPANLVHATDAQDKAEVELAAVL